MSIYYNNKFVPIYYKNKVANVSLYKTEYPIINFIDFSLPNSNNIYDIPLTEYNISNNNTNATITTNGINNALIYAKNNGYDGARLPEGIYSIDTGVSYRLEDSNTDGRGILIPSDFEFIINGCEFRQIQCEDPYYSIFALIDCNNTKITGGTIIGDRDIHDYGMRINNDGNELESGDISSIDGSLIEDETIVRTKEYITLYKDWITSQDESLPTNFYITPLWNTTKNTVDGGVRYIHCYDADSNYLGVASTNGNSFLSKVVLLDNTAKIKISFKDETNLEAVYALTKRSVYYTYEFGSGISIRSCNNIIIDGVTIKDCIGDCILVRESLYLDNSQSVTNCKILNCTLENSRRQGISFVAKTDNILVYKCNIGRINGVDPQCGIDFESGESIGDIKNIIVDNCNFYANRKWDIDNYDGAFIQIKNSTFDGGIVTTHGNQMIINDNNFNYTNYTNQPNTKILLQNGIMLGTLNNIVYKNTFNNAEYYNYGENSQGYKNTFINSKPSITDNNINTFINCQVNVEFTNSFSNLEYNTFNDSTVIVSPKSINNNKFTNCKFINSTLNGRFNTKVNYCTFNMLNKPSMDTRILNDTILIYTNCIFNSEYVEDIKLLGSTSVPMNFLNCNFNISRYTLGANYNRNDGFLFKDCNFIFNDLNSSDQIVYLCNSPYGMGVSPWDFTDCYFKSDLPVNINGNISNATIEGNITY